MAIDRPALDQRVLILAPTTRDGETTRGLLASADIVSVVCPTLEHLCATIPSGAAAVILPEEVVLADESEQLAKCLRKQAVWSDLPVIVLARAGTESPAVERAMSTLGNVSLIERPMRISTLLSTIRSAIRARERQYQVRDYLEEMRRAEERLSRDAMLLSKVQDSVIVTDLNGIVTFWNDGATRLLGWTAEEMIGRPMTDRLPESGRGEVVEWIKRIAAGEEFEGEWLDHRKDGSPVWIEASTRRVSDAAGNPIAIMGVSRDISQRKQTEDELVRNADERTQLLEAERSARADAERAGRMKDEFLATLSHELRTPLNAILGWSQILASGTKSPEDLREGLQTIERNARAQTQIIEDLLDMSRIISGKVRLDMKRIDLASVVHGAVETAKPSAEAKGVHLQTNLDPLAEMVLGDSNRLQQVMWNLLSNAIKFTPTGGRVDVIVKRVDAHHMTLSVTDTGEGIKPEFLAHVFDRFRQADPSTTRRHGGLGLGLAIVKQLVELHGGSIRVNSAGLGAGATFTITLPTSGISSERAAQPERLRTLATTSTVTASSAWPSLAGVNVLVVDDEADARGLVRRLLEDCEAIVTTAGSVSEAMDQFRSSPPDVLVSDIGMPVEDGYSLIRRVRAMKSDEGANVPAVALTAYARSDDRMRSVLAGFQMHLAKPVEPAELITMIASLAGRA